MPVATAVIQIVGLFLIGYTIGPSGGLGAVAPRIPCPGQGRAATAGVSSNAAEQAMASSNVGEHAALLMVSFDDYISSSGWPPTVFETTKGRYLYVKLDGEQVRFLQNLGPATGKTTGRSSKRAVQQDVVEPPPDPPDLGLPHLGCCVDAELRPEYLPSTNYKLAAAVLDLSNGSASACRQPGTETAPGRQDTLVTIANGGTLTIEATKGTQKKHMTVKGTARVLVANAPSDVIPGTPPCHHALNHGLAFPAMMKPCSPSQYIQCPQSNAGETPCNRPTIVGRVLESPPPPPFSITDAYCSNNQWP